MGLRRRLRRAALGAERALDALLTFKGRRRPPLIEPYIGYATPEALIARGRVLTHLRRLSPLPEQGWFTNLRQMLLLFLTDEVEGVRLRADPGPDDPDGVAAQAISDVEGYFTLALPRGAEALGDAEAEGWTPVEARIEGSVVRATLPVLIPSPDAAFGVISDIDDTVMETGAYSLARNLWTSLTGNALTRRVYPDAVALLDALSAGGRNPVFYVSSSPWNLHHFLESVFERASLVRGPKFLRDLGIKETPSETPHGGHKGAAIDTLMDANPSLPFWLIGDTGQYDAEIYLGAARRHPGRVLRVALREPGPGPDAEAREAMDALCALGVAVTSSRDFSGVAQEAAVAGAPTDRPAAAGSEGAGPDPRRDRQRGGHESRHQNDHQADHWEVPQGAGAPMEGGAERRAGHGGARATRR